MGHKCMHICVYIVQVKQVYSGKINPALSFPASIYEVSQALFQFTAFSIAHLSRLLNPWGISSEHPPVVPIMPGATRLSVKNLIAWAPFNSIVKCLCLSSDFWWQLAWRNSLGEVVASLWDLNLKQRKQKKPPQNPISEIKYYAFGVHSNNLSNKLALCYL